MFIRFFRRKHWNGAGIRACTRMSPDLNERERKFAVENIRPVLSCIGFEAQFNEFSQPGPFVSVMLTTNHGLPTIGESKAVRKGPEKPVDEGLEELRF